MIFKEAQIGDISQIQVVRLAVKENVLSNPTLVTDADCEDYITKRGKGWVCVVDEKIVGFAIADLKDNNVWALFVMPGYEGKGIGKKLHNTMLDWYFSQNKEMIWLGTAPNTRAEKFYMLSKWTNKGLRSNGEVLFEMTAEQWKQTNR
jgi:GNAT superfamily N-acetyltransferase